MLVAVPEVVVEVNLADERRQHRDPVGDPSVSKGVLVAGVQTAPHTEAGQGFHLHGQFLGPGFVDVFQEQAAARGIK